MHQRSSNNSLVEASRQVQILFVYFLACKGYWCSNITCLQNGFPNIASISQSLPSLSTVDNLSHLACVHQRKKLATYPHWTDDGKSHGRRPLCRHVTSSAELFNAGSLINTVAQHILRADSTPRRRRLSMRNAAWGRDARLFDNERRIQGAEAG